MPVFGRGAAIFTKRIFHRYRDTVSGQGRLIHVKICAVCPGVFLRERTDATRRKSPETTGRKVGTGDPRISLHCSYNRENRAEFERIFKHVHIFKGSGGFAGQRFCLTRHSRRFDYFSLYDQRTLPLGRVINVEFNPFANRLPDVYTIISRTIYNDSSQCSEQQCEGSHVARV